MGSAKYAPEQNALVWRVRKFPGGTEVVLTGEIELIQSTKGKAWVRPPISADFQASLHASLHASFGGVHS
jgi:AP-2 complex subunit mu-1